MTTQAEFVPGVNRDLDLYSEFRSLLPLRLKEYIHAQIHSTTETYEVGHLAVVIDELEFTKHTATLALDMLGEPVGPTLQLSEDLSEVTVYATDEDVRRHLLEQARIWHSCWNAFVRYYHHLGALHAKVLDESLPDAERRAAQTEFHLGRHPTTRAHFTALMDRFRAVPVVHDLGDVVERECRELRHAARDRLRHLFGRDGAYPISSNEETARSQIERAVRDGLLRIRRAATITAAEAAGTAAVAAVRAVAITAGAPQWRTQRGTAVVDGQALAAVDAAGTTAYPLPAATLEAYRPGPNPLTPSTDPVHIEAVEVPEGMQAVLLAGASISQHRVRLEWTARPTEAASVTLTARSVQGVSHITISVPVPTFAAGKE